LQYGSSAEKDYNISSICSKIASNNVIESLSSTLLKRLEGMRNTTALHYLFQIVLAHQTLGLEHVTISDHQSTLVEKGFCKVLNRDNRLRCQVKEPLIFKVVWQYMQTSNLIEVITQELVSGLQNYEASNIEYNVEKVLPAVKYGHFHTSLD